jgi:hypothetical protein
LVSRLFKTGLMSLVCIDQLIFVLLRRMRCFQNGPYVFNIFLVINHTNNAY